MTPLARRIGELFSDDEVAWLSGVRRDLHRHPELSWREEGTAARLESALTALGATQVSRVARTGVMARMPGRRPGGPAVAIRGDIDALPIQEATGLPFTSEVPGVMHACGHDVHATWAVGAAMLLRKVPAEGDVVILLQPAEEAAEGAAAVLESGALDGVSAIFGGHVDRRYQVGQVVAQVGPVAASADFFEIEITGAGGHGARPHECADPIVGAGALIVAIQTLIARRLDPAVPGVVTVATVHAGTADNIIPDRATLTGTVRAVDPGSRAFLLEELRHLSEGVAAAHRLSARVTFAQGTPPIVNLPGPTAWASEAIGAVLGAGAEVPLAGTNMGGEDFAFYLERMPGCFLRIGAREPGGAWLPAHSPGFYAAEESVFVGAAVLAETARRASAALP
ncbi:MAG: amidohydrolase [Gemmatimonadales bacterium]|nr:amidohydrolase [Gemmatimonadales bacterium]MBA3554021.1 amidohydrolase [Gemmatimonadales bacterium]